MPRLRGPKLTQCFRPILGYANGLTESGAVNYDFRWRDGRLPGRDRDRLIRALAKADIVIPCGKCEACYTVRAGEFSLRAYHEDLFMQNGIFATFTYSDANNPITLVKNDWHNLIQNIRRSFPESDVRYLMCGEYGSKENTERPHFHACLWNLPISPDYDLFFSKSKKGNPQFRSLELEQAWQEKGFVTFSEFEPSCAGYTASYVTKSWTEREAEQRGPNGYRRDQRFSPSGDLVTLERPFLRVSSRPGLGRAWYDVYQNDLRHGFVVFKGQQRRIPRRYMQWLKKDNPGLYERIREKAKSFVEARGYFEGDSSCERLEAREKAAKAAKGSVWKRT